MGVDPERLPPGQYATAKWPVLQAGSIPRRADLATWTFRTSGAVEEPLELSWDAFRELPSIEIRTDIHCVTRWSRFDMTFRGVPFREIVRLTRPLPEVEHVISHGEQGYTANLPLARDGRRRRPAGVRGRRRAARPRARLSRCAWWCRSATSGSRPSGCAASSSRRSDSPASGSATATTTTPTRSSSSARSSRSVVPGGAERAPGTRSTLARSS